jgi:protein-L-isoaspartate(D-aspartate) O-methyltransferase
MDRDAKLATIRRTYAKQVTAAAEVDDARLENAYASVPREHFLGPGPWQVETPENAYVEIPSDDPVHLYTDSVVGIIPERQLNNGQPSFHASLLSHAAPQAGEHVVHIGVGVGYYTAIIAELVGVGGHVTAIEFDAELARRSRINLQPWVNVEVIHGDGTATSFQKADVIYVNAGATRPVDLWLEQLAEGGRLILPLTIDQASAEHSDKTPPGAVFQIERRKGAYSAKWICVVAIFPCAGARDEVSERALAQALRKGREKEVTRLYRHTFSPTGRCWLKVPGWCLAYR